MPVLVTFSVVAPMTAVLAVTAAVAVTTVTAVTTAVIAQLAAGFFKILLNTSTSISAVLYQSE